MSQLAMVSMFIFVGFVGLSNVHKFFFFRCAWEFVDPVLPSVGVDLWVYHGPSVGVAL